MGQGIRAYTEFIERVFDGGSQQEREKQAAHVLALVLVAAVAIAKYVTGLTVHGAQFTLYEIAVAVSAAKGGFAPGLVATLAALVVGGLGAPPPGAGHPRLLFLVEGIAVAAVVSAVRERLRDRDARLRAAGAAIEDLELRDRHGRRLDAALRHLEDAAGETAVVVLNDAGMIVEWRTSAERIYGYSADQVVGTSAASLFLDAASIAGFPAMLRAAADTGCLRQPAVHRRRDGSRVHVDLEIASFRDAGASLFTLTAHDIARRREWDDYREAAARAQAALEQAVDDARRQLAALENLTDPSLNPLGGPPSVIELLERLRATVGADGAALVQPGHTGVRVVTARGLQPVAVPADPMPAGLALSPGRVAIVHNDPARVEQLSALDWPADVTSLMVVPVVHNGRVRSTIEIVSERSRRASDWDVALVRVVADRLAAAVVQDGGLAATGS